MERYGHDSPPKLSAGVDIDIGFRDAEAKLKELSVLRFRRIFHPSSFFKEFEAMIFKKEGYFYLWFCLKPNYARWLFRLEDTYGYAIIKPTAVWKLSVSVWGDNTARHCKNSLVWALTRLSNTELLKPRRNKFTIEASPQTKTETVVDEAAAFWQWIYLS